MDDDSDERCTPDSIKIAVKQKASPSYLVFDVAEKTDPTTNPRYARTPRMLSKFKPEGVSSSFWYWMQRAEDLLIDKAYFQALGHPDPSPVNLREELVEDLVGDYLSFGLASNKDEALATIARIEDAASTEAANVLKDETRLSERVRHTVITLGQRIRLSDIAKIDPTSHPQFKELPVDVRFYNKGFGAVVLAANMLQTEHLLLDKAYCAAMGRPDPAPERSRDELIADLAFDYEFFGLETGRAATEERVRSYENIMRREGKGRVSGF